MSTHGDQIIAAINARVRFMSSQRILVENVDQLKDAQSLQIINFIQQHRGLPMDDATAVSDVIGHGPWTDGQKVAMGAALTNAMDAAPRSSQTQGRPQQNCDGLHNYFTQTDWDIIMSGEHEEAVKTHLVAYRMFVLGMECPSEKLQQRAAQLIKFEDRFGRVFELHGR